MMTITAEEITKRLHDEVPKCKKRLNPARLSQLQIVTNKRFDEQIHKKIIKPLSKITECPGGAPDYKLERIGDRLILGNEAAEGESNYVTQFIKDLRVYGITQAVGFLNQVEFHSDSKQLIDDAIKLASEITKDYLANKDAIAKSEDDTIKRLKLYLQLYEE